MYCVPLVKKPESGSFLLSRMRSPLLAPLSLLLSAACSGLQLGSPLQRIPSPAMSASTTQTTTQTTAQTTAQTTVQSVPVTAQRNGWISQWMDHLKFDSKPSFDVLERTREYVATKTYDARRTMRKTTSSADPSSARSPLRTCKRPRRASTLLALTPTSSAVSLE